MGRQTTTKSVGVHSGHERVQPSAFDIPTYAHKQNKDENPDVVNFEEISRCKWQLAIDQSSSVKDQQKKIVPDNIGQLRENSRNF